MIYAQFARQPSDMVNQVADLKFINTRKAVPLVDTRRY